MLTLLGLTLVLTGQAADPPPADGQVKELGNRQEFLSRQWKEFSKNLLLIAQKLQKSTKPEEQEKAKTLFKVLELAEKEGVENKFNLLVRTLSGKNSNYDDFNSANATNEQLIKVLDQILAMLLNDDDLARLTEERKRLEAYLKELKAILGDQKIARAITETNKADKDQLSKEQKELANRTDNLGKAMSGQKGGDPKKGGGEAKPMEPGEAKNDGENKSEGKGTEKEDTGDPKGNQKPPEAKEPMGGMGGEAKPKNGSESGSESKGKPMGGEGSEGQGKPMGGEPKDPMSKESKPNQQPSESKNKGDQKAEGKESNAKGGEGEAKPSESKEGSGQSSSSKGSGQPKQGGQPSQGGQQQQQQQQQQTPGAEQVKKAVPDQENASQQIEQKKNDNATQKQQEAINKLEEAKKELEKKLKQLREEELERLLANLEARVSRMLAMQKEVKANTQALDAIASKTADKKLPKGDFQRSQQQSDREGEIVVEADKTLQLLQAEGTVVAFPGVLEEVRKDMMRIKERLYAGIVNEDTIAIEQDVIDALTEMLEALKKAQQDLKNGGGGGGGGGGPPPDQKLLDELAELKMIRQLQDNVNKRTKRYGDKYQGEQADDPLIRTDLKDLSGKQEKIEQMIKDMKEGRNK
jgi:hypothetical protein